MLGSHDQLEGKFARVTWLEVVVLFERGGRLFRSHFLLCTTRWKFSRVQICGPGTEDFLLARCVWGGHTALGSYCRASPGRI